MKLTLKRKPLESGDKSRSRLTSVRTRRHAREYVDLGKVITELKRLKFHVRWFRPLSKNIYSQIRAVLPLEFISSRRLYSAIGWHVRSINYLSKLKAGDSRWNIHGKREGKVTQAEQEFAQKQLYEHHSEAMRARRKSKNKIIINDRKGKPRHGQHRKE